MKERPILFSGAMVRAILDGSKTQTRRVIKRPSQTLIEFDGENHYFQNEYGDHPLLITACPYGQIGERLWVRETSIISPKNFSYKDDSCVYDYDGDHRFIQYLATHSCREAANDYKLKATPSIHMPRWASRITLEIVNIRVERLKDISAEDAYEEGVEVGEFGTVYEFKKLWESINGAESWELNPWVWVIEFKRVS